MKLAVIVHRWDFVVPLPADHPQGPRPSPYLFHDILEYWRSLGNDWGLSLPGQRMEADAAFLHVVPTIVDDEYRELAASYPFTVNGDTWDISKRRVSRNLVDAGSDWAGPVIVKSDLNNFAKIEHLHNRRAAEQGQPPPHHHLPAPGDYRVFDTLSDVPDKVWADDRLVVEKFLPERNEDGSYTLRTWIFMGSRERCTRLVVPHRVSKAHHVLSFEPTDPPDELRAERERLGFDYGKFDWVMHEGKPVLLDANRTPGNPRSLQDYVKKGAVNLAEGLDLLLRERTS